MDAESALLQEIQRAPHDDGPRLVYADWLEERSDPRGEFIRLQIENEQCAGLTVEKQQAISRSQQLLAANYADWIAHYYPEGAPAATIDFRRGFPVQLPFTLDSLSEFAKQHAKSPVDSMKIELQGDAAAPQLLQHFEALSDVTLSTSTSSVSAEASAQILQQCEQIRLQSLGLANWHDAQHNFNSFTSRAWPHLEQLTLAFGVRAPSQPWNGIGEMPRVTALTLLGSGNFPVLHCPNLDKLHLNFPQSLPDEIGQLNLEQASSLSTPVKNETAIQQLARAGAFHHLQTLELHGLSHDSTLNALEAANWLPKIRSLSLANNRSVVREQLHGRDVIQKIFSHMGASLQQVELHNVGPLELLSLLDQLLNLNSLRVSSSWIDGDTLAFGRSKTAWDTFSNAIQTLEFHNCELGDDWIEAMSRRTFPRLQSAAIDHASSEASLSRLLLSDCLSHAVRLSLRRATLNDLQWRSAFTRCNFPNLVHLDLSGSNIRLRNIRRLLEASGFPKLQHVKLHQCKSLRRRDILRLNEDAERHGIWLDFI